MNNLTERDIAAFLSRRNYDLRKTHNGRWIDQKCTPDVLWSIADFVSDYVESGREKFTVRDIWMSDYAKQTLAETFSKPSTDDEKAQNEYDKFFSQPLNLLCYAGILEDVGKGKKHLYRIADWDVLRYITKSDTHTTRFLTMYIDKVLKDSGLYGVFEEFFRYEDAAHFQTLKQAFINFYHNYTPIKKAFEPKRIFSKVLNPLAFARRKKGTERGHMSRTFITRFNIMYNQDNFRDVYCDKPKDMTRKQWLAEHPEIKVRTGYFEQQMNNAKRQIKNNIAYYRKNISELTMFIKTHKNDRETASQMHHIFPKNEFPSIMHYLENLIALTPNQHYQFAHPNNNTHVVDPAAQKVLLIAKACSIKYNLASGEEEHIYEFCKFLRVMNVGWDDAKVLEIEDGDYTGVLQAINAHYPAA